MLAQIFVSLAAISPLYSLAKFIHLHFIHCSGIQRYQSVAESPKSAWALVTGASDGIGKGFATQLCQRGFNVILHGRNRAKLQRVADELKQHYPQSGVRIAILDVHPVTEDMLDGMMFGLDNLDITLLVNNVGGAGPVSPIFRDLEALTFDEIATILAINTTFPTMLTAKFLARLRSRHHPALIINVGSVTGSVQSPFLSVYAGTKAFVESWSRSLACEMKATGRDVEIMGLIVGEVVTSRDREDRTSFTRPSSLEFARATLDKVGCGQRILIPHIGHALSIGVLRLLPQYLADQILIGIASGLKGRDEQLAVKSL